MKKKWVFIITFILGLHWIIHETPAQTQKPLNTLTLLYSNNINGEIVPCLT